MKSLLALTILSLSLIACKSHNTAQLDDGRKYVEGCPAANREKPIIDKGVFPNAQFKWVSNEVGSEKGPDGKSVPLYQRQAFDTADIGNGITLEILTTGCESYGNTYSFIMPPVKHKAADQKFWYTTSVDLLTSAQKGLNPEGLPLDELITALRKEAESKNPLPLEEQVVIYTGLYGIGDRGARVDVEQKADKTVLKITHSVSL